MQKQRLLKLADYLDNDTNFKNKVFNLKIIGKYEDKNQDIRDNVPKSCVTAACALGFTPLVFPRARFSYDYWDKSSKELEIWYQDSKGNRYVDFYAAEKFFGLNTEEADYLFLPEKYPTDHRGRKSVAKRIRRFVLSNGKMPENVKTYKVNY